MDILKSAILLSLILLIPLSILADEELGQEPASVCISCHSELDEELSKSVELWKKSIHRQMGNNCEGCHGGDPNDSINAMSPERGFVGVPEQKEIAEFCGKCHVGVKDNYIKSIHHETAQEGIGPTCVTCHNSHDVKKASFELINEELCSQCHSYENGQKIKKAFVSAELALNENKEKLRYLGQRGMPVKRLEEKLFALRNSLHQMTHSLNLKKIENKTREVLEDLDKMNTNMEAFKKRIYKRWLVGAGVLGFLIISIIVLRKLLRTYEDEE
jgi:hypothetical protein